MGRHVCRGDQRGQAVGVLGVVALDRHRDPLRQIPAASQNASDQSVVDPQLVPFLFEALLRGAGRRVEVAAFAGVQARDHQAADIVRHGILLAGGGALLRGFAERVGRDTGMPVRLADAPLTCVASGAGQSLEELDALSSGRR